MAGSASIDLNPEMLAAAAESRAWPFEEAKKIIDRYKGRDFPETVLFETGYGPSGLPHIGTFGEVARTTMVRHAFRVLTEDKVKTKLLCFSDDMDGMRKIPDNVPDRAFLEPYLHMPLTAVPDPFGGDYASFGDHNNAMLRALPRHVRLRLRIRQRDRILQVRPLRRDAAASAAEKLRRDHGGHAADAGRGAPGDLQPVPADLAEERPRALRADEACRRQGRHDHLRRRRRRRPRCPSPAAR